ncbi:MAG: hypothetical protein J7L51_04015 [Desulfurococcales archaeon]|nr:hypothetical protein [Desulfurococcales archaeon]
MLRTETKKLSIITLQAFNIHELNQYYQNDTWYVPPEARILNTDICSEDHVYNWRYIVTYDLYLPSDSVILLHRETCENDEPAYGLYLYRVELGKLKLIKWYHGSLPQEPDPWFHKEFREDVERFLQVKGKIHQILQKYVQAGYQPLPSDPKKLSHEKE